VEITTICYNRSRGTKKELRFMENSKDNPTKKIIILYVLNILKLYSSRESLVSQSAICTFLNDVGVLCDRKTVGRNIKYLCEFGYPIKRVNGKGYFLDKEEMKNSKNKFAI
jgi:biotin operon repressor